MQNGFPISAGHFATGVTNGVTSYALDTASKLLGLGFVTDADRTLNTVRVYGTVAGSLGANDIVCAVYSDNAGAPGTQLASSTTTAGGAWATGWQTFTGFSLALTAGVQYWVVLSNANGTPATNKLTVSYVGSGAGSTVFSGAQQTYGFVVKTTTTAAPPWTSAATTSGGYRLGFADGTFAGLPAQAGNQPQLVYNTTEAGLRFTVPPSASWTIAGASFFLNKAGTPTTPGYVYKLYTGAGANPTLVATSRVVPVSSIGAGLGWFPAYFPSAVTLAPGTVVTLTAAASAAGDTSGNRGIASGYVFDPDPNSVALQPFGGVSMVTGVAGAFVVAANADVAAVALFDAASPTAAAPAATGYTVTGPTNAVAGTAVTLAFTPNGLYTGTLALSAADGSLSPSSLTWSGTGETKFATWTPATSGSRTVSAAASPALGTDQSINLTVASAGGALVIFVG